MKSILKNIIFFSTVMLCLMNTQCEDDVVIDDFDTTCDAITIVDQNVYDDLVSDNFQFVNIDVVDDCISIKISASGCDGNSWGFNLVDSGAVAESSPEQRFLKFELINEELCDAVFQRIFSFDLKPLQIEGSNKIILNIEGYEQSITYSY